MTRRTLLAALAAALAAPVAVAKATGQAPAKAVSDWHRYDNPYEEAVLRGFSLTEGRRITILPAPTYCLPYMAGDAAALFAGRYTDKPIPLRVVTFRRTNIMQDGARVYQFEGIA